MSLLNIALLADVPTSVAYGIVAVLLAVIMLVFVIVAATYGNLWFQAYMSNCAGQPVAVGRDELSAGERPHDRAIENHGHAGGPRQRSLGRHHDATARGPLPGRRQRAGRDPRDHRRALAPTSTSTSTVQPRSTLPAATCSTPCRRASIRK